MNPPPAYAPLLFLIFMALPAIGMAAPQPAGLPAGAQLYEHNCAPCHGNKGEGKIGPSLQLMTDKKKVEQTVSQGRAGAMPAFRYGLSTTEIAAVADFVVTDIARNRAVPAGSKTAVKPAAGDPQRGMALFTGDRAFANGGIPCISCHDVNAKDVSSGGTLGPVLTEAYWSYGAALMNVLQNIPFPTMAPIYGQHPLSLQERQDLEAFFWSISAPQRQAKPATTPFAIFALGGCVALFGLTWIVWPRRLVSAHSELLERARRAKRKS
jgi:mono/diheme cytochrome c family protein